MNPNIRPTGGPVGAEIEIDLARDPAPEVVHAILRAFERYHVLVFREQSLSEARLLEITAWLTSARPSRAMQRARCGG